ncbi:MAG: hypothetical protein LBO72_06365 [Helicobacteraceae bacterium]|jgi:hypothetical protein|nr:hypothetical protein [Helicobacteraceae bacterium]
MKRLTYFVLNRHIPYKDVFDRLLPFYAYDIEAFAISPSHININGDGKKASIVFSDRSLDLFDWLLEAKRCTKVDLINAVFEYGIEKGLINLFRKEQNV